METVKKFGWPPDVIHCSGWMTGLIPMYLKTVYKKEPVFAHSKVIFTIGQNTFKEKMGSDFLKLANIHSNLKEKDLEPFSEANNTACSVEVRLMRMPSVLVQKKRIRNWRKNLEK